jgi:hypothetical protein
MKKFLFLIVFFFLTAANNWLTATDAPFVRWSAMADTEDFDETSMPLGDGEENSGEEDKDTEEDDDEVGLDHRWMSRDKSTSSDLHILYQDILFSDLEIEVVIPPPKA